MIYYNMIYVLVASGGLRTSRVALGVKVATRVLRLGVRHIARLRQLL